MRVLHVAAGNLFGGVETYLVSVAAGHQQCPAMEPEFAICFRGQLWEDVAAAGVPIHDLGPVRMSRPWSVWRARQRLKHVLATGRYDVVVYHMAWVLALFTGVARRETQRSVVGHVHGPSDRSWLERMAARQSLDLLIAPSRHSTDSWAWVYPTVRREVLNYPLRPSLLATPRLTAEQRDTIRSTVGAKPGEVVILHASRIEPWKGIDRTLKALARLHDLPGWRLWVAGGVQRPQEQAYSDELRRIASQPGLADRVTFLGHRTDVPTLMQAADLYCQGNRGAEGFSLAFLEASYFGLPVVTPDLGGAEEMVDADTGILVPPGEDVAALSDALRALITDSDKRVEMGARARQKAVRLSDPTQQLARLATLLNEATQRTLRRAR